MSIFDKKPDERTQLHFNSDGSFEFRKRPLEDSCVVEKDEGKILKAWPHFYSAEYQFDGNGKIPADMVTLSFERDMILDPFGKIPVSDSVSGKPKQSDEPTVKKWLSQLAESQRYKVMNKPGSMLLINKITLFLGAGFILMVLGFLISRVGG